MPHEEIPRYKKLKTLYKDLHGRPDVLTAFRSDPHRFIRQSDLSDEHKDIVLRGDPQLIKVALEKELGAKLEDFSWMF